MSAGTVQETALTVTGLVRAIRATNTRFESCDPLLPGYFELIADFLENPDKADEAIREYEEWHK